MPHDADLLRAHHTGDPAAFAALVARHLEWVYAFARRHTGDAHAAEDVTQATFLALAGRRVTPKETTMAPWLYGVVRNLSANSVRATARRRRHETAAARRDAVDPGTASAPGPWPELVAALDGLIAALPRGDADAVLLRFYERRSHAEVGVALGVSEDSARKRVARAVDKLRTQFARHGLTPEAAEAGLLAGVTRPVPAGLSDAIVRQAAASRGSPVAPRTLWPVAAAAGVVGLAAVALAVVLLTRPPATASIPSPKPAVANPAALAATRPTTLTLTEVIAGIRASERRIRTLNVRGFRLETDAGDTPAGPWQATPLVTTGSAWLDGRPQGRARIDYARNTSPWTNGAAPYYVTQQSASWDGTTGRVVTFAEGGIHNVSRRNVSVTTTKRPYEVDYLGATGAAYLTNFVDHLALSENPATLSEALESINSPIALLMLKMPAPTVAAQTVNGFDTVRVECRQSNEVRTYWLVPDHGYALVRYEHVMTARRPAPSTLPAEERYRSGFDVNTLTPAADGVWVPIDVTEITTHLGAEPEHPWRFDRRRFHADAVVVNDPAIEIETFRLPVPDGFREETRK